MAYDTIIIWPYTASAPSHLPRVLLPSSSSPSSNSRHSFLSSSSFTLALSLRRHHSRVPYSTPRNSNGTSARSPPTSPTSSPMPLFVGVGVGAQLLQASTYGMTPSPFGCILHPLSLCLPHALYLFIIMLSPIINSLSSHSCPLHHHLSSIILAPATRLHMDLHDAFPVVIASRPEGSLPTPPCPLSSPRRPVLADLQPEE
ncbi:hypothetical protein F5148DRAFT_400123 [Russula earlei]|uniref:Uncharacterized protein n=1 Tax=Russula earlei TaxID=71964 RepID=A0ACC0U1B4_9AGAM|nr:hypothetical protein F5148DRAFT_400123 [Russula earlei]